MGSEMCIRDSHITLVTPTLQSISVYTTFLGKQLTTIKPDNATGPDKVRPKDLNIAGESTNEGINIVLQRSITQRKFPLKWKTAKMKVAFKKGETTEPSNYRPLSMLTVPKFAISQSEANSTVLISYDIKSLT